MSDIPDFADAVRRFQAFLSQQGFPAEIAWAFREDVWQRSPSRLLVRWPLPPVNLELAQKVLADSRAAGLVEVVAIGQTTGRVIATAWFPKCQADEVQGWDHGLKLTIRRPLPHAIRIPMIPWSIVGLAPTFRSFQRRCSFIGTRSWAST